MKNVVEIYRTPDSWMNLGKGKKFYLEAMEALLGVLVSFPVVMIIVSAIEKNMGDAYKLLYVLPFLASVLFMRRTIKRDIIYYILCIAEAFLIAFIMPKLSMKITVTLYYIIYTIQSFKKRNSASNSYYTEMFLILGNIILLAEYIICIKVKLYELQSWILIDSIVFSLVLIVYIYMARTKKLMEWEKQTSKEAVKKINTSCRNMVCFLTIFYVLLTLLFYVSGMFKVQKSFINFDITKSNVNVSNYVPQKPQSKLNMFNNSSTNKIKPAPQIVRIIVKIILAAIMLISILIVAYLIFMLIRSLAKKLMEIICHKKFETDEKESILKLSDVKESVEERINIFKRIKLFYGSGNRNKIRKMYYKFVSARLKNINKSDTPHSIEKKINSTNMKSITDIYEKARYGEDDVSSNEVDEMKKFIKCKDKEM